MYLGATTVSPGEWKGYNCKHADTRRSVLGVLVEGLWVLFFLLGKVLGWRASLGCYLRLWSAASWLVDVCWVFASLRLWVLPLLLDRGATTSIACVFAVVRSLGGGVCWVLRRPLGATSLFFAAICVIARRWVLRAAARSSFQFGIPCFAYIPGVTAGKAAHMTVIAVPSLPKQSNLYKSADEVINSLLDFQPEKCGLPPFQDCITLKPSLTPWIEGTLPIEPWHIGGPVIKGFGRGSKVLGIPTANLSTEGYSNILSEHPSGVYFGWAGLAKQGVHKMVMSIGWNPYFNNTEKTIEPWLLHDFGEDFYGEELRLAIVGYIRPETNFSSLESLIAKIHEDRKFAENALDLPMYAHYKNDPYLTSSLQLNGHQ
ncbi:hypothetical protein IFM89_029194 [Coptis chinensis]|uniref:riboflavin kinase n=1 Tax=Coptis chinensis TaxID=261450 RepID=A0A835IRB7_9MAGN|nr:hypothetical protein IFM89_029194 [Coptis chinensis]